MKTTGFMTIITVIKEFKIFIIIITISLKNFIMIKTMVVVIILKK